MNISKVLHVWVIYSNMYLSWGCSRLYVAINLISQTAAAFQRPSCPAPLVQSNEWCRMLLHLMQSEAQYGCLHGERELRYSLRSFFFLSLHLFVQINGTDNTPILFRCEENLPYFTNYKNYEPVRRQWFVSWPVSCPCHVVLYELNLIAPSVFINSIIFNAWMWCWNWKNLVSFGAHSLWKLPRGRVKRFNLLALELFF